MLLNLIKNSILVFLLAILAYMQGNLWKKQVITSKYQKSEKYYMHRFHNPKLSQEGCFKTYIYYASLCAGCSTKKAIDSFFCEALYRKSLNTICIAFRFYNPKLSQERCFKPCVYYIKLLQGALRKKQLIALKKIMKI